MSLPPALALGTFYEGVMQAALRQFFSRATLEIEPAATPSSSLRAAADHRAVTRSNHADHLLDRDAVQAAHVGTLGVHPA